MQQSKVNLPDNLVVLLIRMARNGDVLMAGHVLLAYVMRFWNVEKDVAQYFVLKYFEKHYPKQLQRHLVCPA